MLALAFVMNLSGQTLSLGMALASTGAFFVFLSPVIGWIGVAITGSDTSSNALFGAMQVKAATEAGLNPLLMASANSTAGVLGKMLSPQNLAVAVAAISMPGYEGTSAAQADRLEPGPARGVDPADLPAVHPGARLDGARVTATLTVVDELRAALGAAVVTDPDKTLAYSRDQSMLTDAGTPLALVRARPTTTSSPRCGSRPRAASRWSPAGRGPGSRARRTRSTAGSCCRWSG